MTADRLRTAGRHSRTESIARNILGDHGKITETSRAFDAVKVIWTTLYRAWTPSSTETAASNGLGDSGRLLRGSRFVKTCSGIARPVARNIRQSANRANVTRLAGGTEAAVSASWLYRWLTAEPEPEVIVIDLRKTVSVGPVIGLLDQLIRQLVPASHRSTVVEAVETVHQSVTIAPVRAVSLLLGVAVLTNLLITLAVGEPTQSGVAVRIVFLGIIALGSRISMTWDELVETRPVQLLIAALEPPEPPN